MTESHRYTYNESSQLVKAETYDGKKKGTLVYTYDADGNLISETGTDGAEKVDRSYTYTVENRLEAVYEGDELLMAAAYDGDGNRVFQLNYNLHTDEDWKGNSGNGNGNNKDNAGSGNSGKGNSKSEGTDDAGYGNATNAEEHNSQNQSGILFPIDEEVSDTEDYLISLIKTGGKEKNYELIEYINDVNREHTEVLTEQNINGKTDTSYIYGVDRLSLDRFDDSTGYYLYDPKGSVTGITNEEGQIYQSYRYDVFGEITYGKPQYENEYAYNAESYNPNIESQYLRARYYNVKTAAFFTEDSYLGDIMEPLTLNRYSYCLGNPVNYEDPSGHWVYDDEQTAIFRSYAEMNVREKAQKGIRSGFQMQRFLSALRELHLPNATVDYVSNYNYYQNSMYVKYVENMAREQNANYACEVRVHRYNIMDMHMSQEGLATLMYWETVNAYSLGKGYLQIAERSESGEAIHNVRTMQELQTVLDNAQKNNTEIFLKGVAPHDVGDGSITVGFGDYLTGDDVSYYESKGYLLSQSGDHISIREANGNKVEYIPVDISVEKYLMDVQIMENKLKDNLQKELAGKTLYYSQREFDALMIMRYQVGSLRKIGQNLILNREADPEEWRKMLRDLGVEERRIFMEVDKVMFGNGKYIDSEVDLTPLWGVSVKGIVE